MWESNFLNAILEVSKLWAEGRHNDFDSFIYFHNWFDKFPPNFSRQFH
jgi:hypothetical protein